MNNDCNVTAEFEEIQQVKDRMCRENLALRDEVDRTLMFEEMVDTSKPRRLFFPRLPKSLERIPPF